MRSALTALSDELRRLKTAGVKTVLVSEESVAALRRAVAAQRASGAASASTRPPAAPVVSAGAPIRAVTPAAPAPMRSEEPGKPAAPAVVAAAALPAGVAPVPEPTPFALPEGDKATRMAALRERVLNDPVCLAHVRPGKRVVVGVGSLDAKIMFVGEAPGAEEEVQGEPFVGPAGQLLTKMIAGMGLKREDVYIGNIMNWRPEMAVEAGGVQYGNRPPTENEMRYCLPYLQAQIAIVHPSLLVALGKTAVEGLLGFGKFKTLAEARSRWHEFAGKPLMVTYHPSYILREPTNRKKRMIWDDLLKVMERAELPISEKQRGYFLDK